MMSIARNTPQWLLHGRTVTILFQAAVHAIWSQRKRYHRPLLMLFIDHLLHYHVDGCWLECIYPIGRIPPIITIEKLIQIVGIGHKTHPSFETKLHFQLAMMLPLALKHTFTQSSLSSISGQEVSVCVREWEHCSVLCTFVSKEIQGGGRMSTT